MGGGEGEAVVMDSRIVIFVRSGILDGLEDREAMVKTHFDYSLKFFFFFSFTYCYGTFIVAFFIFIFLLLYSTS